MRRKSPPLPPINARSKRARRAKYPRRPRRVALWGDLGGAQFSVTEVNREGRAPARPRALSIAASKLFRIIISEAIVTEVGEILLRKMEMVGEGVGRKDSEFLKR